MAPESTKRALEQQQSDSVVKPLQFPEQSRGLRYHLAPEPIFQINWDAAIEVSFKKHGPGGATRVR
jgi:hypothetical protein